MNHENHEPLNVGLDFGTTYTVVSRLTNVTRSPEGAIEHYTPQVCSTGQKTTFIDSTVLKTKSGALKFGISTRDQVGSRGTVTYKGFKMMLAESDSTALADQGYDEHFTPEYITKEFLDDILTSVVKRSSSYDGHIHKLVVGVPEIWFSRQETNASCKKLLEILSSLPYVDEVEPVSEPAAACAFFADKYQQMYHHNFHGRMLLIDYGGGTLDIALCDVEPDGQQCKVSVRRRAGEGFNEEGKIGTAGLAFMQEVVYLALAPSGLSREEIDQAHKQAFYKCLSVLENQLMARTEEIEEVFSSSGEHEWETFDDEFLGEDDVQLDFNGDDYSVTYGMLAKAYNTVIRGVLNSKLDEIIDYMKKQNIDYNENTPDVFKIYPVGGFCNFYLTKRQIYEKFHIGAGDSRFPATDAQECETAISFGAALIADSVINFRLLAPYSLGVSANEKNPPFWFFRKGDEMPYGEPQFNPNIFTFKQIKYLVFHIENYENGDPILEYIDIEKTDYLDLLTVDKLTHAYLGFSLDRSMVLTLHRHEIKMKDYGNYYVSDKVSVRLNNLFDIFGGLKIHTKGDLT